MKLLARIVGLVIVFVVLAVEAGIRFSNAAMTETQLFLSYWPAIIILVLVICVGTLLYAWGTKEK